jgi:hypothetical protein
MREEGGRRRWRKEHGEGSRAKEGKRKRSEEMMSRGE